MHDRVDRRRSGLGVSFDIFGLLEGYLVGGGLRVVVGDFSFGFERELHKADLFRSEDGLLGVSSEFTWLSSTI